MSLDSVLSKLDAAYAVPEKPSSSLSGNKEKEQQKKGALQERIAHLDPFAQSAIKELSQLQHGYAIRAYESDDGLRAGIIAGPHIRHHQSDVVRRFSQVFFGMCHSDICVVFKDELRAVGRRYRK